MLYSTSPWLVNFEIYILIYAKNKMKPQPRLIPNTISREGRCCLVFLKRRLRSPSQHKDPDSPLMSEWRFMLSCSRSSFPAGLSIPSFGERQDTVPLETLWRTPVEAKCPPVKDRGHRFTSPVITEKIMLKRSKMSPAFGLVFLAFLLFQWNSFSASIPHQPVNSGSLIPIHLHSLCCSSCLPSLVPARCPISLLPYPIKFLQRNVLFLHVLIHSHVDAFLTWLPAPLCHAV